MRLATDLFAYCAERLPSLNTISISGYHIREAGASAAQELAFTLANGIAYCEAAVAAGLSPDAFGERLSFFFNAHNHFFQEVAKFRAARRLWARDHARSLRRDEPARARAPLPRADRRLDAHGAAAGEQHRARRDPGALGRLRRRAVAPHELLRRGARAADASTRRRSRCARSRSSPPRPGTTDTADPLGGAYFVEALTDELEQRARELIARVDELGGAVAAIEQGFVQAEIEASAFRYQREVESGERVVVGVNAFTEDGARAGRAPPRRSRDRAAPARAHGTRARRARRDGRRSSARRGASRRRRPTRTSCRRCARRSAPAAPSARSAARCASFGVHMTPSMRSAHPNRVVAAALLALAIPLAALAALAVATRRRAARRASRRDVAPIIADKCAGCHQIGGIAPFPLATARQISSRAALDRGRGAGAASCLPGRPARARPPTSGRATRTLSAPQRATILAWARAGGKVDGPARRAAAPTAARGARRRDARSTCACPPRTGRRRAKGVTDDYRCFLLDPKQLGDASVTSARIEPGQPKVVHHVILFRVAPAQVAAAQAPRRDVAPGPGWSCFGGTGLPAGDGAASPTRSNDANWIAAWAPGWGGNRLPEGTGVPLPAGSQIVMQVHYNLLNGRAPDRSRALLTVAPASAGLEPLQTMLLPGPVELACAQRASGASSATGTRRSFDLARKYGSEAAFAPAGPPHPLPRERGEPEAERSLDVRSANLDADDDPRRGRPHAPARRVDPARAEPRNAPRARAARHPALGLPLAERATRSRAGAGRAGRRRPRHLPPRRAQAHARRARRAEEPRYVLWGEGTTDEMCLGILQVTRG